MKMFVATIKSQGVTITLHHRIN